MVPLSVLLRGGCDRLICCFAARRPSLSHCLFCCLCGCRGTSCCFMRGSCHHGSIVVLLRLALLLVTCALSLSYEVLFGTLNNIKRVSHTLFIDQISNSSDVLER